MASEGKMKITQAFQFESSILFKFAQTQLWSRTPGYFFSVPTKPFLCRLMGSKGPYLC